MTVSSNNPNFAKSAGGGFLPAGTNMAAPALDGNPDTVQQRSAMAQRGKMLQKELLKDKSTGLSVPGQ